MAELTICAPLRAEQAAVLAGLPQPRPAVVRTGMGGGRTRRRLAGRTLPGPVAVMGVAGGLAPQVRPGDVVVATELRGAGPALPCPSAPLLAGALRRAGLRVHTGPVLTAAAVVSGAERASLATTGALAVDMESYAVG